VILLARIKRVNSGCGWTKGEGRKKSGCWIGAQFWAKREGNKGTFAGRMQKEISFGREG
jgi:hypothetical protein